MSSETGLFLVWIFKKKLFCHIVGVENVIKGSVSAISAKEQEKYTKALKTEQ